ncbi:MAG: AAA family ATPase [Thiogranum sp.]
MSDAESSQSAPAGYLETFSLRCEPFAERIDNRFFYAGSTLMQRLDLLTHLTQFGDSVILVSGPPGSGKTTLLSRFIAQSNNQWRLCLVDAADDFNRFHERLADTLGSGSFSSDQELLNEWENHSDSFQLLVILVDNAEQLDESALDRLCALHGQASANRIRIILFGIPEAQQRLKQTFEQKALPLSTQRLEMPRLNEEETSSYLMYRLAVAGYSGESPFTATEVRAMCKAADGRPAALNRLAGQALRERQERSNSKRLRPAIGKRRGNALAWGLASLGILSVAVYLGWQRFYSPPGDAHQPNSQQRPMQEHPLALPEPIPLSTAVQRSGTANMPKPAGSRANETVTESTRIESSLTSQQAPPAEPPLLDSTALSGPVIRKDNIIAVMPAPAETPAPDKETQEKAVPPAPPLEQPPLPESASLETVKAEKPAKPRVETAAQTAAIKQIQAKETLPHRESWLLEQPEAFFSLQLVGSRNEKSIANYIRRHKLDEHQAAYYRGHHQGAAWYVLMYGVYPTKTAALQGRDTLPAKIRKAKPWLRSLKSVHTSIREAK